MPPSLNSYKMKVERLNFPLTGIRERQRGPKKIGALQSRYTSLERIKKYCSQSERGFLGFSEALAKEQVPKDL